MEDHPARGLRENTENLRQARELLNLHVREIHETIEDSNLSAYQVIGQLVRLSKLNLDPIEFELIESPTWASQDYRTRSGIIADLCSHLKAIGDPANHIWKGVGADVLLESEQSSVQSGIGKAQRALKQLQASSVKLAEILVLPVETIRENVHLSNSLRQILKIPEGSDTSTLNNTVWNSNFESIEELVKNGNGIKKQISDLNETFVESAWTTDLTQVRHHIKAIGKSFFRFFSSKYRTAKQELDGLLKGELPPNTDEQVVLVDHLIHVQTLRKRLHDTSDIGRLAFGDNWLGEKRIGSFCAISSNGKSRSKTTIYPTHCMMHLQQ